MPIKEDFCKGDKKPIGKINYSDGENFHWVWPSQAGEAGNDWDASTDEKVLADYKKHGEKMEKLGITGTMVANDWETMCPVYDQLFFGLKLLPRPHQFRLQ